jgi:hypothetical protein
MRCDAGIARPSVIVKSSRQPTASIGVLSLSEASALLSALRRADSGWAATSQCTDAISGRQRPSRLC